MDAKYSQYPPQNQYPQQNLYPQYPPPQQQQQQPPIVINVPSSGYPGMRPMFACHFTY